MSIIAGIYRCLLHGYQPNGDDVPTQLVFSGAFASRPAPGTAGHVYIPNDVPWITHCFDDGAAWHNFFNGLELAAPPTAGWTWRNQGAAVRTDEKASILIECADTGAQATKRLVYRALPAASNYTITAGFYGFPVVRLGDNLPQGNTAGLFESSSGKTSIFGCNGPTNAAGVAGLYNINADDSFNSFQVNSSNSIFIPPPLWFVRVVDNGTSRVWYYSNTGAEFHLMGSLSRTSFITPDNFLWGCNQYLSMMRLVHYATTP